MKPYNVPNVNTGPAMTDGSDHEKVLLGDLSDDELLSFIERIRKLHSEYCGKIRIYEGDTHSAFSSTLKGFEGCVMAQKHLVQQAALLAIAQQSGLLENDTCFVEFGAGRGQLSSWIMEAVPDPKLCSYLLVDKGTQRHKADNRRKDDLGDVTTRLRIGIEDLVLDKVGCIQKHRNRIVCMCKHLCGVAIDFALRCVVNTLNGSLQDSTEKLETQGDSDGCLSLKKLLLGLVMATCCHHRCLWKPFCGRDFFDSIGLTRRDFGIMCAMAGWATCNSFDVKPNSRNGADETETNDDVSKCDETATLEDAKRNRYLRLGLSAETRKEIGFMCKKLMDTGRCRFLADNGFDAEIVQFVSSSITLENFAICGKLERK